MHGASAAVVPWGARVKRGRGGRQRPHTLANTSIPHALCAKVGHLVGVGNLEDLGARVPLQPRKAADTGEGGGGEGGQPDQHACRQGCAAMRVLSMRTLVTLLTVATG